MGFTTALSVAGCVGGAKTVVQTVSAGRNPSGVIGRAPRGRIALALVLAVTPLLSGCNWADQNTVQWCAHVSCTWSQEVSFDPVVTQPGFMWMWGPTGGQEVASVDAFRNSIGVNCPDTWWNTSYGNWTAVIQKLQEAGISHIRSSIYANPNWNNGWNQYLYQLINQAQAAGVYFNMMLGNPYNWDGGTIPQLLTAIDTQINPNMVDAFEYPNEFDISGDPNWVADLTSYGRQEYAAVKADPTLASKPVLGPSLVGMYAFNQLGDISPWVDAGNLHPYTGATSPTNAHDVSEFLRTTNSTQNKPVWATEAGFTTALNETGGTQPSIDESGQAVYILRTFLQHFADGIGRTYAFRLLDPVADPGLTNEDDHWGLLRYDFSEKPAFVALKNLTALAGTSGGAVNVQPISLGLSGDTAGDLQHLILEKANGSYEVMLWRTASVWNTTTLTNISVTPETITVTLPNAHSATVADPISSTTQTGLSLTSGTASVSIGADPLVLNVSTS
jgi:hypothetical protein